MEIRTPDIVIAGAPKCGTTSVFSYLSDHPEICPSIVKETYFLVDEGYPLFNHGISSYHKDGIQGYGNFFSHCSKRNGQLALEATPDYLYQRTALEVLPVLSPPVKLIFILRKPSERIWSLYKFAKNNVSLIPANISFERFVEMVKNEDPYIKNYPILYNAIRHSQYIRYLLPFKKKCLETQINIYLFENMVNSTYQFMQNLCHDINIDGQFYRSYKFEIKNESYHVRNQRFHRLKRKFARVTSENSFLNKLLRNVYFRINVKPNSEQTRDSKEFMDLLEDEFSDYNQQLDIEFKIDISGWQV